MIINSSRVFRCVKHPFITARYIIFSVLLKNHGAISKSIFKQMTGDKFFLSTGEKINWEDPENLNQWIHWLYFNSDTSDWSRLADKYNVRKVVKNITTLCGINDCILVDLFNVWYDIDDFEIKDLPESFVLKMNNGCGDVKIVHNKSDINETEIKEYFRPHFNQSYGANTIESHYTRIRPVLLAERLLDKKSQNTDSSSMIDYKFWCFNGKPVACFVALNRTKESFTVDLYSADENWKKIDEGNLVFSEYHKRNQLPIPKPYSLTKMLKIASELSKGYPQMRVDLYEENNKVFFGEITMTSQAGKMDYFTSSFQKLLGKECREACKKLNII